MEAAAPLSKRKRRREERYQRQKQLRLEKRQQRKEERRRAREQREAERQRLIAEGKIDLEAERRAAEKRRKEREAAGLPKNEREAARARVAAAYTDPGALRLVVDMGFDELMTEAEAHAMLMQLQQIYGRNTRAQRPAALFFTSFGGGRVERALHAKVMGSPRWRVERSDKSYLDLFPREQLVYLTADSDTPLLRVEPGRVYVIGGMVDHNRLKGATLAKAREQRVQTARLPIREYMEGDTRVVLTVNQVAEIMLAAFERDSDWAFALQQVMPPRKGYRLRPAPLLPGAAEAKGEGGDAGAREEEALEVADDREEEVDLESEEEEEEEEEDEEEQDEEEDGEGATASKRVRQGEAGDDAGGA
jgi:tRNA (guanine9-N1)-methyltransferase